MGLVTISANYMKCQLPGQLYLHTDPQKEKQWLLKLIENNPETTWLLLGELTLALSRLRFLPWCQSRSHPGHILIFVQFTFVRIQA